MGKRLTDVDLYKTYCNWIFGTDGFRCYFRPTNFVSLKHYTDFELIDTKPDHPLVQKVLETAGPYDAVETLVIVDLPGNAALDVAYGIRVYGSRRPVLLFNGVLHPNGLIGDKEYISRLLMYGETVFERSTAGFALILDSQRFGEYEDEQYRICFNNQYELGEEDLPSAEMLKEEGCKSILFIHEGCIKEDIDPYLNYLEESGIAVYKENYEEYRNG
jgi:hypothetical protein